MLAVLDAANLDDYLEEIGADHPDGALQIDLAGRSSEEGFSDVTYEKGSLFFRMIEEAVGRERWDPFLRRYFEEFAFRAVGRDSFLEFLRRELIEKSDDPEALEQELRLEEWIDGPGLPPNTPRVASTELESVKQRLAEWSAGSAAGDLDRSGWTVHHTTYFLRNLPGGIPEERLAELDASWDLTGSGNAEVLFAWFQVALAHDYEPVRPAVRDFLTGMGRRKFLEPIYRSLAATPEGLERARSIYAGAAEGYHPLARTAIETLLE